MTRKPELAVLVPAYNAEKTISRALESTLSNLPKGGIAYVLDDGSLDNTRQIVGGISDDRLVLLPAQDNRGVANALNTLLEQTDSKYVARMDADDICLPGRFERQLRAIRDGSEISFTSVFHISERPWQSRPMLPVPLTPKHTSVGMLIENMLAHSTMVARREVLEQEPGPYRPGPAEDYDLWLRLIARGVSITRLALPGVGYRTHSSQVTAQVGWSDKLNDDEALWQSYWAAVDSVLGVDVAVNESVIEVFSAIDQMANELRKEGWAGGTLIVKKARQARRQWLSASM